MRNPVPARPQATPRSIPPLETLSAHLQNSLVESRVFAPNKGTTLRQRLLLTLLPTTLIPLVVAGWLGFLAEKQRAQGEALALLQEESFLAAYVAADFVAEGLQLPSIVAINPSVQRTLKDNSQQAEAERLATQPTVVLEKTFADKKLFRADQETNRYLADLAQIKSLGDLSITESHGFNLAYSEAPPDFVQQDERWWQTAKRAGQHIGSPELDRKNNRMVVAIARAIKDPTSQKFLGVIRALVPTKAMDRRIATSIASSAVGASQAVQIVDARTGIPFNLIDPKGISSGGTEIIGGSTIASLAIALQEEVGHPDKSLAERRTQIIQTSKIKSVQLQSQQPSQGEEILTALASVGTKTYSLTTVPRTNWIAITSVDVAEVESAGNDLIKVFATTTLILGLAASGVLLLLANQLSYPLNSLTRIAETATEGNLDVRSALEGTSETRTLGQVFNTLLDQIQRLLLEQKQSVAEQQALRQNLEQDITQLMEDISEAAAGDLRVRATLSEGDVGIVADLFNAIIENLRLTAFKVKTSTGQVTSSLAINEAEIRELTDQAIAEAKTLQETLTAVEEIAESIQDVAANAGQASQLTQDTYSSVQAGTAFMDETAGSILSLRLTVSETAKKIKRLGESAQKISQTVGLIDEIALKTNLLAVNASVEAARAGELGQGFTAVAEQVGALAEQSSKATKEISQIVATIQTETQEVVQAIEMGTAQVVDSTNLVEATKQNLSEILGKSKQINQLMKKIADAAIYQTQSSSAVTTLVQQVAQESEQRSASSSQMAQAIQVTAQVARELEASVEQFKLHDQDAAAASATKSDSAPTSTQEPAPHP